MYLQRQESKYSCELLHRLHQLFPAVTLRMNPEPPVPAAENSHHKSHSCFKVSSLVCEHCTSCAVYCPSSQGSCNIRRVIVATYAVPTRHSAWWFLATSVTCQSKPRWLANCHAGLSFTSLFGQPSVFLFLVNHMTFIQNAAGILAEPAALPTQPKEGVWGCS